MVRHFHEELNALKQKLALMGSCVEAAVDNAVLSLLKRDPHFARQVLANEKRINQFEIEIDEMGHKLMALGQPMAVDLRLVTAILKINIDLERLGDHAVNIAERALLLMKEPPLETNLHLPEMTIACCKMLKDSLKAFASANVELARGILKSDDEVDSYNDALYSRIEELMIRDPLVIKTGMKLVRVGHDLERIADLANNIAEDVVYMKEGKEVRHRIENANPL